MKAEEINIKNSKKRNAVIELLEKEERPMKVKEIYNKLRAGNNSIYISTIYRTLNMLIEKHIIIKSYVNHEEGAYYEINKASHRHFIVCLKCHEKILIDECPLKNMENSLLKEHKFKLMEHRIELYGVCENCSKNN